MFLAAVSQLSNPIAKIPFQLIRVHKNHLSALHQICAQPLGAAFGNAIQRGVATGAVLLRNKPNGGGKLPAVFETPDVASDVHQHSDCRLSTNPGTVIMRLASSSVLGISSIRLFASSSCSNKLSHISRRRRNEAITSSGICSAFFSR